MLFLSRKFGKKNVIKIDPLAYNIGIIGESGIGKTTLAKEVCEKLVGDDGYIIANVGKEDGIDAIAGAIYEDIPEWDVFEEFCDDIIENKTTDYKNLKVVIWDTIDELINIAEPEAIRLYNNDQVGKKNAKYAKTIKQAWGGYGNGEKYTIDLIMDKMWELKRIGVAMFLIGHTKKRTMSDPVSEIEYDILTTNMQLNYFNALKTKLHILGVASINRQIVTEKTNKKDFDGKEKTKGSIANESRRITFRDDNFSVDSKSRFSEIADTIPLNSDEFIRVVNEAIKIEHEKQSGNKSIEDTQKEQAEKKEEEIKENVNKKKIESDKKKIEAIILKLTEYIKANKTNPEVLRPLIEKSKEFGYVNPAQTTDLKQAEELLSIIEQ